MTRPSIRARSPNVSPSSTARMNSSDTRTELLAFWYWTLAMSAPPRSMSKPASRRARILSSSRAFVWTNSSMSGWSMSSTTIFAARSSPVARRVRATHERHRAGGRTAARQQLLAGPDPRQVETRAGSTLEDEALLAVPVQDRVDRVVEREDEAGAHLLRARGSDVEPHGRVEREHLVEKHVREFVLEDLGVGGRRKVAALLASDAVLVHDAADELAKARLALLGAERAAEVLRRDDRRCVDAPGRRELHAALLEDRLTGLPVRLHHIAALPGDLVVRVHPGHRVDPLDSESVALVASPRLGGRLGHDRLSDWPRWPEECVRRVSLALASDSFDQTVCRPPRSSAMACSKSSTVS